MAEITASLVKELRVRTGAGMMDCKKALTESNGDIELAIENMRKSGAIKAAKKADDFIRNNLCENGTLFVSYREQKRGVKGFLDDYASYIFAELQLYKATQEQGFLNRAKQLCDKVITDFKDTNSGYNFYSKESEKLILNPKETYDGAIPSGNSLMAYNLVNLFKITQDEKYKLEAAEQLDFISADAMHHPTAYSMFLVALLEF